MCGAGAPARESGLEQGHRTCSQFIERKMFNRHRQYPSRSFMVRQRRAGAPAPPHPCPGCLCRNIGIGDGFRICRKLTVICSSHSARDARAFARCRSRFGSGTLTARARRKNSPLRGLVMPDHVHLLLSPRRDSGGWPFPLVDILQCMKSATAHRINKLLHLSGPVWEEESFDHVLRSDETLKQKCEYIRQNPVRRGLAQSPEDYRWLWVDPEFM